MSPIPCPVCRSNDTGPWAVAHDVEYRTSNDGFTYYRCLSCGALFLHPMPIDRLGEIYPDNYYAYASGGQGFVHRVKDRLDARRFRRLLRGLQSPSLSVLDVGGGDGWLLTVIRGLDSRVGFTQVVDMDPGAEALARNHGHEYFCGQVEDFDTDRSFDLVLLLNLIEHVADPRAVLTKAGSWLTPGGVVLVKTPNVNSLDARLFRHHDWGGYHCPRHWVLFDRTSFTALAAETGLAVRSFSYTQGAPFWAVSVLAGLGRRRLARVTPERPMVQHPLFPLLAAGFAAFDLARASAGGKLSQMFLELVPQATSVSGGGS